MHALSTGILALSAFFLSAVAIPVDNPIVPPQPPHPPADQVYIKGMNYAGSGCPAGSAIGTLASDGSNINIAFDNYIASVGKGIPITESRKNCQINIDLMYPPGWSYSIYSTEYRGYVALDKKVTAIQQSDYWFPGESQTVRFSSFWEGPVQEDYKFTDDIARDAIVWSPCKSVPSTLNINTQIRASNMKNSKGNGMITTDVINHKVIHIVGCQWRRCPTH